MLFKRKRILLDNAPKTTADSPRSKIIPDIPLDPISKEECTVLVINSSHEMAKEITLHLTLKMPSCSIMYAPTLELAKWMLIRRSIHLVISSHILPDGSVSKLKGTLESLETPPDLVILGNINVRSAEALGEMGYEYISYKKLGSKKESLQTDTTIVRKPPTPLGHTIKNLGADIRNDLNNPLQEIVAMVFVAQASGRAMQTDQALDAIDKAAKNMSSVVNGLEDKILKAVSPLAARA